MSAIEFRPLEEHLSFGARVTGVTAAALDDEAVKRELNETFEALGMIVFEGVEQTAEMQVKISNVFGPLKDHPIKAVPRMDQNSYPGVITISTGPKACIVEIDGKQLASWQPWHFDHSYMDQLNRAGVLRAEKIAPEGGLTGFADGIQIYRDLPADVRAKVDELTVIYDLDLHYSRQQYGLPKNFKEVRPKSNDVLEIAKTMPRALHPAVWTRTDGERVLHMSPYGARGLEGMENSEGDRLFDEVWAETERAMTPYYHRWKPTDMLLWDNWRMLHLACGCDPKYDRIVHRTTIKGDYGLGRWETTPTDRLTEPAEMM